MGQRLGDALHRALAQRCVSDESRGDAMTCDQAHEEAGRRATVAHVQSCLGLQQSAHAHAPNVPDAVIVSLDLRAHRTHRRGSGQHILSFQQAFDAAFPNGQCREHE